MRKFPLQDVVQAQEHSPQIARWTVGDVIYVIEAESDYKLKSLPAAVKEARVLVEDQEGV